jgi:hypothetical protein
MRDQHKTNTLFQKQINDLNIRLGNLESTIEEDNKRRKMNQY